MKLIDIVRDEEKEKQESLNKCRSKSKKILRVLKTGTTEISWGKIRWEIDVTRMRVFNFGKNCYIGNEVDKDFEAVKIWEILDNREIMIDRTENDELFKNLFLHIQRIFAKFGVIIIVS